MSVSSSSVFISLVRSSVMSFVRSVCRYCARYFFMCVCLYLVNVVRSLCLSSVRSFVCSFVRYCVASFVRFCVRELFMCFVVSVVMSLCR